MEINDKVKNLIFFCEGGIGKNISSTAVIRAIKKAHPTKNIIAVAGCPEVFMHNPNVKRTFHFGNALHFFEDWINEESQVIRTEPYMHYDYINKTKHVVECWCEQIGVPFDGIEPDFYFTPNEIEAAKLFTEELTDGGATELVLMQWIGGSVPDKPGDHKQLKEKLASMYRRAMPVEQAQKVVDYLTDERGWTVINVAHGNMPQLKNCKSPFFPIRAVISLLTQAKMFVGIDSFLQHAAAAKQINKKGVVVWGGTSKTCLGYDLHTNLEIEACITPACHRPNSYLMDVQANGQMWDCPYGEPCMKRELKDIIKAVEEIVPFNKKDVKKVKKIPKVMNVPVFDKKCCN